MKKKIISTILAVGMTAALLAGCGSSDSSSGSSETATETGTEVTSEETTETAAGEATETDAEEAAKTADSEGEAAEVNNGEDCTIRMSWWGSDARHQAILKVIDMYEAEHPNVTIEAEYQGYDGYYEKMMTTLSSGTAPDLFQFHRDWLADVQGSDHYLADLSQLPELDLDGLADGVLEKSGMYDGEPVLYSCSIGGQVMYVNSEVADKCGIDVNKQYTWDEWMQLGSEIHEQYPDTYLMTADIDVLNRLIVLTALAQQTGTSIVDEDTYELTFTEEQMTKALQLVKDLYDTNTCEPYGEAAAFVGQMDQNSNWINNKIGVLLDITGGCARYEASISAPLEVMTIPRYEDSKCSGVDFSGNMGYCINDRSEYKDVAADFLNYMLNDPDASLVIKDNLGYPASEEAVQTLTDAGELDAVLKQAVDISKPDSYTINAVSSNTELEQIRKDILQEVIYEDMTPEEGAADIIDQYEDVLSELKAQ